MVTVTGTPATTSGQYFEATSRLKKVKTKRSQPDTA